MDEKDIDVNSKIVLAIANRMEASCQRLKKNTDEFKKQWVSVKDSFDDIYRHDIEQIVTATSSQIDKTIKNQQASRLMKKYIETLSGRES